MRAASWRAPYIAGSMAGILPYLGVDKSYTEEERQNLSMTVGDYSDKPIEEAKRLVESAGIECEVVGNGPTVLAQLPANGENVSKANSKIILYTASVDENGVEDKTIPYEYEEVPDVVAKSVSSAITRLTSAGFSVYIKGAVNYDAGSGAVVASRPMRARRCRRARWLPSSAFIPTLTTRRSRAAENP